LRPANCRLLDPLEAVLNGAGDGTAAMLIVGFESAYGPVRGLAESAVEIAREMGGRSAGVRTRGGAGGADAAAAAAAAAEDGAEGAWRSAFLRMPYLRDALLTLGVISETFETAATWAALPVLHEQVTSAVTQALEQVCGDGVVTCRLTHAYPDGAAPYFTVIAPGRMGSEISQWREVKAAASEALLAAGGTITHHHAVGRDHRPWYDRQRPDAFALALRGAKAAVDPSGILNPGVLVD
jgi:alkyldihydroxyacetonephosphate synthase